MNLRSKTRVVLYAAFCLVVAAVFMASRTIILKDFVKLDEERLRINVQQVNGALEHELT